MYWTGGMEEVAGDAEFESELGKPTVDSKWSFVPLTEPTAPESELETELVTADASYPLHKIVHTAIQIEEMGNLELTNRSSTWYLDSSSNGQEAWHEIRYGSNVR